jgi:hypothetical protein
MSTISTDITLFNMLIRRPILSYMAPDAAELWKAMTTALAGVFHDMGCKTDMVIDDNVPQIVIWRPCPIGGITAWRILSYLNGETYLWCPSDLIRQLYPGPDPSDPDYFEKVLEIIDAIEQGNYSAIDFGGIEPTGSPRIHYQVQTSIEKSSWIRLLLYQLQKIKISICHLFRFRR